MANLNESFGQDVQAEAAQKLRQFQFHGLVDWRCFVPSRLVAEFNRSLCRIQMVQSPVRDRDAMGVSREILENLLGTSEWRFGINIPALGCRFANLRLECPRLGEFAQIVVKLKLSRSEEPLEPSAEFSLEHCRQGDDRKQESFTGCFPIQSVQSHTPAGDNAMDMIMIDQGLTPGMQHQRQSQLNTKIVSTEFQQRLRGSPEEQVVHHSPVLPDDWMEPVWQGEDNVKIGNGQEQLLLSLQPFHRLVPLAIGTMPVAAGSGHEVLPSAMFAAVTVAAQLRRLAGQQRVEYFPVMRGKSRRLSRQCGTQHLCQAQPIPLRTCASAGHNARGECLQRWLGPDHRIQRIAHRFQGFSADVQITQSRGQTHVSEQPFDDVYRSSRIN